MIIRGGENIYPREIEEFLFTHPAVEQAAVVGVPDPKYGEELCAWIKLKAGATAGEDDLRSFCRANLAHYKVPRYVEFVDAFPQTVTGKIQKFKIREQMIARAGAEGTGNGVRGHIEPGLPAALSSPRAARLRPGNLPGKVYPTGRVAVRRPGCRVRQMAIGPMCRIIGASVAAPSSQMSVTFQRRCHGCRSSPETRRMRKAQRPPFRTVGFLLLIASVAVPTCLQSAAAQEYEYCEPPWLCTTPQLTGDWWGARDRLAEGGMTLQADNASFYIGNTTGGAQREFDFGGHGDYVLTSDLGRLGIQEGFFVKLRAEHRFGETIVNDVGCFISPTLIADLPVFGSEQLYLTNVLFTQMLSDSLAIFAGKMDTLDGDMNAFAHGAERRSSRTWRSSTTRSSARRFRIQRWAPGSCCCAKASRS